VLSQAKARFRIRLLQAIPWQLVRRVLGPHLCMVEMLVSFVQEGKWELEMIKLRRHKMTDSESSVMWYRNHFSQPLQHGVGLEFPLQRRF